MAITFVKQFQGSGTSLAVPAAGVAQGNTLIVGLRSSSSVASMSDSKGNTYNKVGTNPNDSANFGGMFVAYMTTALVSGDTITPSGSTGMLVAEFSGISSVSPVDQSVANSSETGTFTGTSTATLTGSTDLYIAAIEKQNVNASLSDTTTGLTTLFSNSVDTTSGQEIKYKQLAANTAINYSGVVSSQNISTVLAALLPASPPVNTVAPVVSGTTTVGQTLSTTNGTWTGDTSSGFTYQWKDAGGNIASATSSTYVIGAGELGASIHCTVTATGTGGSTSADSNTVGPIASATVAFLLSSHTGRARVESIEAYCAANLNGWLPFQQTGLDQVTNIEQFLTNNPVNSVTFVPFTKAGLDRIGNIEAYLLSATSSSG